uniref:Uncharacterized protein n=1 Tax=Arundo donax TaxID=35708 RepID=A0A0A8XRN7_ARUDO
MIAKQGICRVKCVGHKSQMHHANQTFAVRTVLISAQISPAEKLIHQKTKTNIQKNMLFYRVCRNDHMFMKTCT